MQGFEISISHCRDRKSSSCCNRRSARSLLQECDNGLSATSLSKDNYQQVFFPDQCPLEVCCLVVQMNHGHDWEDTFQTTPYAHRYVWVPLGPALRRVPRTFQRETKKLSPLARACHVHSLLLLWQSTQSNLLLRSLKTRHLSHWQDRGKPRSVRQGESVESPRSTLAKANQEIAKAGNFIMKFLWEIILWEHIEESGKARLVSYGREIRPFCLAWAYFPYGIRPNNHRPWLRVDAWYWIKWVVPFKLFWVFAFFGAESYRRIIKKQAW